MQEGTTPLHSAVSGNHVEVAVKLIEKYKACPTAGDFMVRICALLCVYNLNLLIEWN